MEIIVDEPDSSVEGVLFQIAATDLVVASSNGGGGLAAFCQDVESINVKKNDSSIHDTWAAVEANKVAA
jgi:hypothetical protein